MISPKRISESRSTGSSIRSGNVIKHPSNNAPTVISARPPRYDRCAEDIKNDAERTDNISIAGRRSLRSAMTGGSSRNYGTAAPYSLLVVVLSLRPTLFDGLAHIMQDKEREGRHALLLFRTESRIEWLPGCCEPLQVGRSLRQSFGASVHEGDGITIGHDLGRTLVRPFSHRFCDFCKTCLPILRPGTNSTLYRRPVFCLFGCQLQRSFDQINSQVCQLIPFCRA